MAKENDECASEAGREDQRVGGSSEADHGTQGAADQVGSCFSGQHEE